MTLDLAPYQALIRDRCGLLFTGHNMERLSHALVERTKVLSLVASDYENRLRQDADEFQLLVNLLTINETYFFREAQQIRLLVDRLIPRLREAGRGPVRILSAGCSSGEEPFSLAMALIDSLGAQQARQIVIVGADIDTRVLTKAREARFTEFSFRGVTPELRARHFHSEGASFVVRENVRNMVQFCQFNALDGERSPELCDFDIVFFRNVSIYFDAEARLKIQKNLWRLMREDAVLVMGMTETLINDLGVFRSVEEDGLFYFAKGQHPNAAMGEPHRADEAIRANEIPVPRKPTPSVIATQSKPKPVPPPLPVSWPATNSRFLVIPQEMRGSLESARRFILDKEFDLAGRALDTVLAAEPAHIEALLLQAYVQRHRKDYAGAALLAQRVLAVDEWSIDAPYLLGLIARSQQQPDEAVKWFKRVVYAEHACWPAHYYLGGLYRDAGVMESARRSFRVVNQLLTGTVAATGIQYLPVELPQGEIRLLCERQLNQLGLPSTKPGAK